MNELQLFDFKGQQVRTMLINDEPYFVSKEVTDILGYSNSRDAVSRHVDEEDKAVVKLDTLGGKQQVSVINESGLYSLILSSKLPRAKEFKRWVTSEVLPAIHKTGQYNHELSQFANMNRTDQLLMIATEQQKEMQQQNQRIAAIEQEIETTRYLHPGELDAIKKTVQQQVHALIKADGYNTYYSDVSKFYFHHVGRQLLDYFGVPNRQMILQKDFDKAMEFVQSVRSTPALQNKVEKRIAELKANCVEGV